MNALRIIGVGFAVLGAILHLATYRPRQLQIGLSVSLILVSLATPFLIRILYGSLVNPMAALWGTHSVVKVSLASALFAAYLPCILLLIRRVGSFARGLVETDGHGRALGQRALHPSGLPVWLSTEIVLLGTLALGAFFSQAALLVYEAIRYPHPLSAQAAMELPGFGWVGKHHTPAIHHTYAAASFFTLNLLLVSVITTATSVVRRFVTWVGQPRILRRGSLMGVVAGAVLVALGG